MVRTSTMLKAARPEIEDHQPTPTSGDTGDDGSATVDFHVAGVVGVRLVGATRADVKAVQRQLGCEPSPLKREPEIIIRFDPKPQRPPMRLLGLQDAGYTDRHFFVLRGSHKTASCVQIPLETVGETCEIVCASGTRNVPLLIPIVNFTALAKNMVPIHASAVVHNGAGILACGWSKGGKTEALLGYMSRGARYVGDDWVYVAAHGQSMVGIPEPIRLQDWHLAELPSLTRAISGRERVRLKLLQAACLAGNCASRISAFPAAKRVAGSSLAVAQRHRYTTVPPRQLFGDQFASMPAPLDRLLLMVSHDRPTIEVHPIDPADVALRIIHSNQHERLRFMAVYEQFRFAFPQRSSRIVDEAESLQRHLLMEAFAHKPAYAVYHPYPVRIPELVDTILAHTEHRG